MKTPEIGDTVVIQGVMGPIYKNSIGEEYFYFITTNGSQMCAYVKDILDVIPKPWEPAVGDVIVSKDGKCKRIILHISDDYIWIRALNPISFQERAGWISNLVSFMSLYMLAPS